MANIAETVTEWCAGTTGMMVSVVLDWSGFIIDQQQKL